MAEMPKIIKKQASGLLFFTLFFLNKAHLEPFLSASFITIFIHKCRCQNCCKLLISLKKFQI
jgi:hypothetical protein